MSKQAKSTSKQKGSSGPWKPVTGDLVAFKDDLMSVGNLGPTEDQTAAFNMLKQNAMQGNPYYEATNALANDAFNTADRSGVVTSSYETLQNQLGDYASGKYLDPMSNPQMQAMLSQVSEDAFNRINAQFAGAGRDLSGMNSLAAARGVTQAQLPLLLDQYNRAQDMQMNAAQTLYGAGQQTATTQAQLDAARQQARAQGIDFGNAAMEAQNYAPTTILNLDQQMKQMPYEDRALLASLLYPMAGFGQEQTGKASSTTKMPLFSDARVKENIAEVGKLADGQKVYAYNYKGDDTPQIGLMAQEVEKRNPEAVVETPEGIKMVHYDAATAKAAEILRKRKGGK